MSFVYGRARARVHAQVLLPISVAFTFTCVSFHKGAEAVIWRLVDAGQGSARVCMRLSVFESPTVCMRGRVRASLRASVRCASDEYFCGISLCECVPVRLQTPSTAPAKACSKGARQIVIRKRSF
eukprot:4848148-Pleurochrysis_carterae.AAC.2